MRTAGNDARGAVALRLCAIVSALLLLSVTPARPQSITAGEIEGTVRDTAGAPFAGALVHVTDLVSGVSWSLTTTADGRFRFRFLPPSSYQVVVEDLGYQPIAVRPVPVLPGRIERLELTLPPAVLPVDAVREVRRRVAVETSRAGMGQWFGPYEIVDLPEERRELTELGRLSSLSDETLATEGLPGRLSSVAMDGQLYEDSRHPDLAAGRLAGAPFPLSHVSSAELLTVPVDVEWSGAAGAYLSGYARRGTRRPDFLGYGDWSGGVVTSSDYFSGTDLGTHSIRGGALVSGPIVDDTAHYVIGIEAQRLEVPLPRPWVNDSLDADLAAVAGSFGANISPYLNERIAPYDIYSGFAKFDWQITQNHAVSVRGSAADLEVGGEDDGDPDLGPGHSASLGSELQGVDLSTGATLTSQLGGSIASELRVGVDRSDRDYDAVGPTGTRIVDGGFMFGDDPTLPAEFKRLGLDGSETVHVRLGPHRLKAGVGGHYESIEQRYTYGRGGVFAFGGPEELADVTGAFEISAGVRPLAKFQTWQLSLFAQDSWAAAPGLDVTFGLRYEYEKLDSDEVRLNSQWEAATGLRNTAFDDGIHKFSPRFGFLWNISRRNEWLVRGATGVFHGRVAPGVFGELVTQDGRLQQSAGVGALGSWPDPPGPATIDAIGPRLTLLSPDFAPPRSARAGLGVSRLFPDGTAIMLAGNYRFTDKLPRRDDLNLSQAPSGQDQYGRPIYGSLVKEGSLVAATPGTNRRFPDFGLVSALNSDGDSRFWGFTAAVERRVEEGLNLLASYTFSWTRDDWLSAGGGGIDRELSPFPRGLDEDEWEFDTSDLDVPHRAVLGAELALPRAGAGTRVAVLYRFRSGRPYTPGFRAGVDVNGDGSGLNDPAFVDPSIPGMESLLEEWDCLADQVLQFAERNSCRQPAQHMLDARVAIGLVRWQDHPLEIVFDVLNALDTDTGLRDSALLLLDPDAPLDVSADGVVTLPFVANPNFGEPLVRRSTGRAFRFGLRMGL